MSCAACEETFPPKANFCPSCGAPRPSAIADQAGEDPATTAETVKHYAKDIAHEAADLSKAAIKSDLGKKMAAGAAIGAVAAIPIPFVGPAVGAMVGAGIVAFRRITK